MTRLIDILVAALGLVLVSPLLALAAIAVKLSSPGPVLHRARRVGRAGVLFDAFKLRSMRVGQPGPPITVGDDTRITTVGRWLRSTKVDELPQLVNVLRGEMSLVGPRPEDPRVVASYGARQRRLLSFRPGITSPASLRFRAESEQLATRDWERDYFGRILPEKLRIDLEYFERRTIGSDLAVMWRTVVGVLGFARRIGPT